MPLNIHRRILPDQYSLPADIHPVLRRIYAARNIKADDLDYTLKNLLPYADLAGIQPAVSLLAQAIKAQRRILILADFDTDGATSCVLAIRGLKSMGAKDVVYLAPNRFDYGYGLSPEIVTAAAQMHPDIILTVDNGIASITGVQCARAQGIDVLITDHHLPGKHLPNANAIVNPNQPGDQFPSKNLAGVGVMFYLLIALRAHLRQQHWFAKPFTKRAEDKNVITVPNLAELLDLVALGTVVDLVPLDRNNRILVHHGLTRIRRGKTRPGIKALLQVAGVALENLSTRDLSFAIGPRLNAAGRLRDMSLGIECLLSDDLRQAEGMARKLDELNRQRREIQQEMHEQALLELKDLSTGDAWIKNNRADTAADKITFSLCLFNETWHQGVVGILAAKIKDRFHCPVVAFARDKNGLLKGSARSIPGLHIRDVLAMVVGQYPGLIDKFGGHAMAAGLSLAEACLPQFKQAFDQAVRRFISAENLSGDILSDGDLTADEISLELARTISQAGPWGQGFPEPQFDGEFKLISSKVVADKHLKLKLDVDCRHFDAIAFNFTPKWQEQPERIRVVYGLEINEYRGSRQLQLVIKNVEPA